MQYDLKPKSILLVEDDEDDEGDVELFKESFKSIGAKARLEVIDNGEDAISFLQGKAPFDNRTLPSIILLDLNLPRLNGTEVLSVIKHDPLTSAIPVIVFTTSENHQDIENCYLAGANSFVSKPEIFEDFAKITQSIKNFWLETARLPAR